MNTCPLKAWNDTCRLEYPLTGCSYNATQSSSPWTCPKQRTGLVATTKLKQLRAPHLDVREQNQTRVVRYLNQGGYRVVIEAKAGIFKRTVFSSTYSWKDTPDGLQVIGLRRFITSAVNSCVVPTARPGLPSSLLPSLMVGEMTVTNHVINK